MGQLIQSVLLAFLLIFISVGEAWACRCKELDLQSNYINADAVAIVKINKVVILAKEIVRASGEVLQSWKSILPHSLSIFTGDDCMYPFEKNSTYLLYLARNKKGNFGTYQCWGNRPEKEATDSLQWLMHYGKSTTITQ